MSAAECACLRWARLAYPAESVPPAPSERTVLHAVVREHLESWLALQREGELDAPGVPAFVERISASTSPACVGHGFGRARCPACGHDFLVAFSCRARAVCPSCNARRMAETAAHLMVRQGLLEPEEAEGMRGWDHGGGWMCAIPGAPPSGALRSLISLLAKWSRSMPACGSRPRTGRVWSVC